MAMAGLFDFILVPRVHELRFIPKWWLPAMDEIKLLKGTISIHPDWQYARPIGAGVLVPDSLADLAMGAADVPGTVPVDGAEAMPLHGRYVPPVDGLCKRMHDESYKTKFASSRQKRLTKCFESRPANENTPRTADNTKQRHHQWCFGINTGVGMYAQMQVRKGDALPCASQP